MTQEDKKLLLKDLSARLQYGVYIRHGINGKSILTGIEHKKHPKRWIIIAEGPGFYLDDIKPYLRPMSSMTEEERKYVEDKFVFTTIGPIGGKFGLVMPVIAAEWLTDFYNSRHLDYRGLIEKGLALEAPEGMYNIKNMQKCLLRNDN